MVTGCLSNAADWVAADRRKPVDLDDLTMLLNVPVSSRKLDDRTTNPKRTSLPPSSSVASSRPRQNSSVCVR